MHGCAQSAETVRDWTAALNTAIRQGSYRPRKLLVFLNPYGGAKRARQVWQTVVAPIFDLAGKCHANTARTELVMTWCRRGPRAAPAHNTKDATAKLSKLHLHTHCVQGCGATWWKHSGTTMHGRRWLACRWRRCRASTASSPSAAMAFSRKS